MKPRFVIRLRTLLAALLAALPATYAFGQDQPSVAGPHEQPALSSPQGGPVAQSPSEPLPAGNSASGLSLEHLEQLALANNPSIARAAAQVAAARGNWSQVGLLPNPSVGYEGQQLGSGGLAEQHGVAVSQEIVRGGKLRLNRNIAAGDVAIAEQQLAAQQQRVLTDVRLAFYQVLLADRQIEIAQGLVQINESGMKAANALQQAKEVGRGDVLQSQLELENGRIQLENARHRRQAAWQALTAVVGCTQLDPQALSGDASGPPKVLSYDETLARLVDLSPEVAAANQRISRAAAALDRARVERVGNVNFQGLVNWRDNGIGGKPDGGVGVMVPVPVFDRNQGGIRRAEAELTAARREYDQIELSLKNRLAPVFEQYLNARNQVQRYQTQILPAAKESLELTQRGYQAGEINYIALLTAQRTYAQINWNYLEALRALRVSETQIDGFLLDGSLQSATQ